MISPAERQLGAAAVWSTISRSTVNSNPRAAPAATQYHLIAVDAAVNKDGQGAPIFASDIKFDGSFETMFAVRDWHRAGECSDGDDAVKSGCVTITKGHDDDALVVLDRGMSWPHKESYEGHTPVWHSTQLYTITPLVGDITLLGELDKFVPLSSERFSDVVESDSVLTAVVSGAAGEVIYFGFFLHNPN